MQMRAPGLTGTRPHCERWTVRAKAPRASSTNLQSFGHKVGRPPKYPLRISGVDLPNLSHNPLIYWALTSPLDRTIRRSARACRLPLWRAADHSKIAFSCGPATRGRHKCRPLPTTWERPAPVASLARHGPTLRGGNYRTRYYICIQARAPAFSGAARTGDRPRLPPCRSRPLKAGVAGSFDPLMSRRHLPSTVPGSRT
jgi:hypothetical protein